MDLYAMYLRKSRTDEQAEARGEGDALSRHRKTLTELAAYNHDFIAEVYEEIGSADSISGRREIQRLLMDVIAGKYKGVYCMDIDRLSRGNAADQATIMRAFQASETILRTPGKDYDFTAPADEDFGETKLFFGRIEYKTIKRRLYKGRERSAEDGYYLGSRNPYGYERVPASGRQGPTLRIIPEQAENVRWMFHAYADGQSSHKIADALNARGVKPNYNDVWTPSSVRFILRNPLYAGYTTWAKRIARPAINAAGEVEIRRVLNPKPIIAKGKHPEIVSDAEFDTVSAIMGKHRPPATKPGKPLENPLAGLVRCARCGHAMVRHNGKTPAQKYRRPDVLRCANRQCDQMRANLATVEDMILEYLDQIFDPAAEPAPTKTYKNADRQKRIKQLEGQIAKEKKKFNRQAELLEEGIYTSTEFIERRNIIAERLQGLQKQLDEETRPDMYEERLAALRAAVGHSWSVSEAYRKAASNEERNQLLKSIFVSIEYDKTEKRRGKYDDQRRGVKLEFKLLF